MKYIRARSQRNEVARRLRQQQLATKLSASYLCINLDEIGRRINARVVKEKQYGTLEYVIFRNAARSNAVICYESRQSARQEYRGEKNSVLGATLALPTPSSEDVNVQKKRFCRGRRNWVNSQRHSWKSHYGLCTRTASARFDNSRQLLPLPCSGTPLAAAEDPTDITISDEDGSEAAIPSYYRRRKK